MGTAEIFRGRAIEADERAAKALTPQEKQTWMNIAFEYRQYAKMAEQDEQQNSSKLN